MIVVMTIFAYVVLVASALRLFALTLCSFSIEKQIKTRCFMSNSEKDKLRDTKDGRSNRFVWET